MLCSLRWALALVVLTTSFASAQPPVPPPVPPLAPPPNTSPLPPALPVKTPDLVAAPNPTPAAPPGTMDAPKPNTPPSKINERGLAEWLADFKSSDPTVRERAVKVIPLFGVEAARKQAIKPLTGLLDDPDPGVRVNAILIIATIGFDKLEDLKTTSDKLASVLGKTLPGSVIRVHATRALGSFGREAFGAINAVVAVADDPSWEVRAAVATTLGRIGGIAFEDKAIQTTLSP